MDEEQRIVERARELFAADDIEIDADAATSWGDDGVWVQAWVLVPHE
jgi:hypothetical protein